MTRGIFVTGTDTGVGKTFAGCALLRALGDAGADVVFVRTQGAPTPANVEENVRLLAEVAAEIEPEPFTDPVLPAAS